jgi:hypothetical protein
MKTFALVATLVLAPAFAHAQSSVGLKAGVNADVPTGTQARAKSRARARTTARPHEKTRVYSQSHVHSDTHANVNTNTEVRADVNAEQAAKGTVERVRAPDVDAAAKTRVDAGAGLGRGAAGVTTGVSGVLGGGIRRP